MVLKSNDRRTSCPCHDEFRGPHSDYVRQVALATTQQQQLIESKGQLSESGRRTQKMMSPSADRYLVRMALTNRTASFSELAANRPTATGVSLPASSICQDVEFVIGRRHFVVVNVNIDIYYLLF
ncbi:hypothetical protein TNCV_2716911 [Trichonephila clavipes]|nr:hypothetical protein TNCV_2716911 [Trichonephila clavipes]